MEQKTKKWLVAGALTIAVAIGVGTCYSNTSDKSGRKIKKLLRAKRIRTNPKKPKQHKRTRNLIIL